MLHSCGRRERKRKLRRTTKKYQSIKLLLIPLIHDADTRLSVSVANKVNYKFSSIIHIRYYKGGILFH